MPSLSRDAFNSLSTPGPRLDWLSAWLTSSVWSSERLGDRPPIRYLEEGERMVNELEEIISAAAPKVYDELTQAPANRRVSRFMEGAPPSAIVIFDGLSLREAPALLRLAGKAGFAIEENGVGLAALPSETLPFVEQHLECGQTAPSQLAGRRDLKDRGCAAYYYSHAGERHTFNTDVHTLLLWSSFPDNTYKDSGARFAEHFAQIQAMLESAWNATVMAVPRGRRVLITSDHGYIFLGSGLTVSRDRQDLRPLSAYLGGDRCARISERGHPPDHPDLAVYPERDLAVLKGRIHPHPPGPASNKLYKHGGLSLMEMLTPWLVLSR